MNKTNLFLLFLVFILFLPTIYGLQTNISKNEKLYYNQEIDIGLNNLPQTTEYINILITDITTKNIYFDSNVSFLNITNYPFSFLNIYPNKLIINYTLYDNLGNIISNYVYPILLNKNDLTINYYFCNTLSCNDVTGNIFNVNQDIYLFSSNPQVIDYNIIIKDRNNSFFLLNKSLPLNLNLEQGEYQLTIKANIDDILYSNTIYLIVNNNDYIYSETKQDNWDLYFEKISLSSKQDIDQNSIEPSFNESKTKEKLNSKTMYILFGIIVLILISLLFIFSNKKNKPNVGKEEPKSRREEFRSKHQKGFVLFILFLLLLTSNIFADRSDMINYFKYLEIDYPTLESTFTYDYSIDLYVSPNKTSTEIYYPIALDFLLPNTIPQITINQELDDGSLSFEVVDVLFMVDPNKIIIDTNNAILDYSFISRNNLPTQDVSQSCKEIFDFYSTHPITTKLDLIQRTRSSLINDSKFSKECISELINKHYLFPSKQLLKVIYNDNDSLFDYEKKITTDIIINPESDFLYSQPYTININYLNTGTINYIPNTINHNILGMFANDYSFNLNNIIDSSYVFSSNIFEFNPDKYIDSKGGFGIRLNNYFEAGGEEGCFGDYSFVFADTNESIVFKDKNNLTFSNIFVDFDTEVYQIHNLVCDPANGQFNLNVYYLNNMIEKDSYLILPKTESPVVLQTSSVELKKTDEIVANQNLFDLYVDKSKLTSIIRPDKFMFVDNNIFNKDDQNIGLFILDVINSKNYELISYSSSYVKQNYLWTTHKNNITISSFHRNEFGATYIVKIDNKIFSISSNEHIIFEDKYSISVVGDILYVYKIKPVYTPINSTTKDTNIDSNISLDYDRVHYLIKTKLYGNQIIDSNLNIKPLTINESDINKFNYEIFDIINVYGLNKYQTSLFWADVANKTEVGTNNQLINDYNYYCKSSNRTLLFNNLKPYLDEGRLNISKEKYIDGLKYNYILPGTISIKDYNSFCSAKAFSEKRFFILFIYGANYLKSQDSNSLLVDSLEVIDGNQISKLGLDFSNINKLEGSIKTLNYYIALREIKLDSNNSFIKQNYLDVIDYSSLNFKFPKRKSNFNQSSIASYIGTSAYSGWCSRFVQEISNSYTYGVDANKNRIDYISGDAWHQAENNQSIWKITDGEINKSRIFEGTELGIFLSSESNCRYDLDENSYSHVIIYVGDFKNKKQSILSAESEVVHSSLDDYLSDKHSKIHGFQVNKYSPNYCRYLERTKAPYYFILKEVIVPYGFYDNTIKDELGKTELDYVKEYLLEKE